jgi:hypothetical protein
MRYEIRVDGRVDADQLAEFASVTATAQAPGTVLGCDVPDSAALTGLIAMLSDRGFVVHDVHRVSDGPTGHAEPPIPAPARAAKNPAPPTEEPRPPADDAP